MSEALSIKVFDLHCDTASTCLAKKQDLFLNNCQLDLKRGNQFQKWIQTFAFWIDDRYRGEDAWQDFEQQYAFFTAQCDRYADAVRHFSDSGSVCEYCCNVLLSIEGGAVLGGRLERIAELKKRGIRFFTLVWNEKNEIASGAQAAGGLTAFGKEAVAELERNRILVDISHLNDESFYDLIQLTQQPLIATHSNARAVCDHPRNLTDDQIEYLIAHHGLIGMNFYPLFVNLQKDCTFAELFRHVEHILALGGERVLALGSDFDGADMPNVLSNVKKLETLYQSMVKCFGKKITDRIFYQNALDFTDQNKAVFLPDQRGC